MSKLIKIIFIIIFLAGLILGLRYFLNSSDTAPQGGWDVRHEEACEEASLIMIHAYLAKKELTRDKAEKEIQAMIDFEIKTYGDYKDTNVEQNIKLYNGF